MSKPTEPRIPAIDRLREAGPIDEAMYLRLLENALARAKNDKTQGLIETALKAARAANDK